MTNLQETQQGAVRSTSETAGNGRRSADVTGAVLLHVSVLRTEASVARVREQALAEVVKAGLRQLGDVVRLVLSELATNAVRYGQQEVFDVLVRRSWNGIRIEVDDRTLGRFALFRALPDEAAEHGRGLLIVEAVAEAWGTSPDGRVTWAEIALAAS